MEIAFAHQKEIAEEEWFSEGELSVWGAMSDSKRLARMLGRIAVKKAARRYFEKTRGDRISWQSLIVKNRASGAPYLFFDDVEQDSVTINLSHGAGFGVAAIDSSTNKSFGVDIERLRRFESSFLDTFLNNQERMSYKVIPEEDQSYFATIRWSLKEACLKAFGTGLHEHPDTLSIGTVAHGKYPILREGIQVAEGEGIALPKGFSETSTVAVLVRLLV